MMTNQATQVFSDSLLARYESATVVGLGTTGYSVVRYLQARGLSVSVVDSRKKPPYLKQLKASYPKIVTVLGTFDSDLIRSASLLIVSPGVSLAEDQIQVAKQNGAKLLGDIELFIEENTKPIIAITGSNGKTTVTTLVGAMCAAERKTLVAGNIGKPVLDALTDQEDYEVAVLELSSFQLETIDRLNAQSATILNISADHMDRYASMGDYVLAKAKILRGAKTVVVPRRDSQLQQITLAQTNVLSFGLDEPANDTEFGIKQSSGLRWLMKGDKKLIKRRDVPLTGSHNICNVLAAYALAEDFNLNDKAVKKAVKAFQGLPHRMQTVNVVDGVTWVNDSKATNIGATSTALQSLDQNVIWIAGGQGKGADFTKLQQAIKSNLCCAILFGEDSSLIEQALQTSLPIHQVENLPQAVALAASLAKKNSVVLLSPACASFDMYDNYEHRGNHFIELVRALKAEVAS